jgi:predicted permease
METMLRDIRYSFRQLLRSRGFALAAILTIALGVGANSGIFSVVYGLLVEALPLRDSQQLVSILETIPNAPEAIEASFPDYQDWRSQQTSFSRIAAYSVLNPSTVSLRLADRSEQIQRVLASGNFFSVLGVTPFLGRTLEDRDDTSGAPRVAVLSDLAWRRYFGGNPGIVSQTIELDGSNYTVVGILPPRADFPAQGDVWLPLALLDQPTQASRVWHSVRVIGRLRAGISLTAARTEMQTIAGRIAKENPATNRNVGVRLSSLRDQLLGGVRLPLLCVMGSVVLVLLIACTNVGNLILIRVASLQGDLALRRALGSSQLRIFSQYFAQALWICILGGLVGTLLAVGSLPLIRVGLSHIPGLDSSLAGSIRTSFPVLGVTLAACTLTALAFGGLPLFSSRRNLLEQLKETNRLQSRRPGTRQYTLISVEVAIAVVVSFLSLLLLQSFNRLIAVNPGYRIDHVLSFEIALPQPRYQTGNPQTNLFFTEFLDRIRTAPGVESVATTTQIPLNPSQNMTRFLIEGDSPLAKGTFPAAQIRFITPSFFTTMGLRLESGRIFTDSELQASASLFVVNDAFAKRYLSRRDPIGAKVLLGVLTPQPTRIPVIGVVSNAHEVGIQADPPAELFLPGFGVDEVILVRTANDPRSLIPVIQRLVHATDPGQAIYHIQTMDEVLSQSVMLQRMTAILLALFAGVALILAAIGVYGVLAFSVVQRTPEIGVRMALGANRKDVIFLFLRAASAFVFAGMIAGFAVAFFCSRWIGHLLFNTRTTDAESIIATILILAAVTAIAVGWPAFRAARANPSEVLRIQ